MKMVMDARRQHCSELADLVTKLDHDARSPLTAICGYAECLGWVSASEAEARAQYAAAIVSQAQRLGRLIACATTVAGPQLEAPLVEIGLTEAIDAALETLAGNIESQGLVVDNQFPPEAVLVSWSRSALNQLLVAALECVFDCAGEHATVTIEIRPEARDVVLLISADSAWPIPLRMESFTFRAAARLVGTRGGSLLVRDSPQTHLQLHLPYSGRLAGRPTEGLERSA